MRTYEEIELIMCNILEDENLGICREALEIDTNKVLTNKQIKSINLIVDYLQDQEQTHFEECTKEEQENHILNEINILRSWLDGI